MNERPFPTIAENGNARPTRKAFELAEQAQALLAEVERLTRRCGQVHDEAVTARNAAIRLKVSIGAELAHDHNDTK